MKNTIIKTLAIISYVFKYISVPFRLLNTRYQGNTWKLKSACRKARKKHKKTGKHYRVYFLQNRYRVLTRDDLQKAKHQKKFGWHVNSSNMEPLAFYDTSKI